MIASKLKTKRLLTQKRRLWTALVASATLMSLSAIALAADRYVLPLTDPDKGRELFINKGCVVCHAVNGVGGTIAPALDADPEVNEIDPYSLMARMWAGADAMLLLQAMELGYQIEFTAQELAQIDRFLSDLEAQQELTQDDVPDLVKQWMVDEFYERL